MTSRQHHDAGSGCNSVASIDEYRPGRAERSVCSHRRCTRTGGSLRATGSWCGPSAPCRPARSNPPTLRGRQHALNRRGAEHAAAHSQSPNLASAWCDRQTDRQSRESVDRHRRRIERSSLTCLQQYIYHLSDSIGECRVTVAGRLRTVLASRHAADC